MRARLGISHGKTTRIGMFDCVVAVLCFICVAVMELFHDHECVGAGCMLCLASTWARVLLCLCMGVVVSRPVLHIVMRIRTTCAPVAYRSQSPRLGIVCAVPLGMVPTPLNMGVLLRI